MTTGPATERRALLLNSVVAAVLGSGLMVLAHESCHLVTGLAMGIPGTLYSFGVDHGPSTPVQMAITAGSAPVFSLVTGVILALWQPLRARAGFGHLLWLWFAYASLMEGVGYLEITPFGAGDTASVVRNMGWPQPVGWALLAIGVIGQFAIAWGFAHAVGRIAGRDRPMRLNATLWPWLIGTAVNVLLGLLSLSTATMPGINAGEWIVILLAGSATLVFAPMAMIFQGVMNNQPPEPLRLRPVPVAGIVALVLLLVLNQILNTGIRFG